MVRCSVPLGSPRGWFLSDPVTSVALWSCLWFSGDRNTKVSYANLSWMDTSLPLTTIRLIAFNNNCSYHLFHIRGPLRVSLTVAFYFVCLL